MQKRFVIIDGNALVHRAYHALPPLTDPKGRPVQAVYGFARIFFKMIRELQPTYIAACFDVPKPTFRHKAFEAYKAHRPKTPIELSAQMPVVQEFLKLMNVPVITKEGLEADDLIATLTEHCAGKDRDLKITILTGDLDTLQLVKPGVEVYTPRKGVSDTVVYQEKDVRERHGGLPPSLVPDIKGLQGDPSDNIPGVKGIGAKRAIRLLQATGSLEGLYQALENKNKCEKLIKDKIITKKLVENLRQQKEEAFFSKELATARNDVPIEFSLAKARWGGFSSEKVKAWLQKMGFRSLISQGQEMTSSPSASIAVEDSPKHEELPIIKTLDEKSFNWRKNLSIKKPFFIGVANEIFILIGFKEGKADGFRIDMRGFKKSRQSARVTSFIKRCLSDSSQKTISYGLKELVKLTNIDDVKGVRLDLELAVYLLEPGKRNYALKEILASYGKSGCGPGIFEAAQTIERRLKLEGVMRVYSQAEQPLTVYLAQMESNGIMVDQRALRELQKMVKTRLDNLEDKILELAGQTLNLASPQQVSDLLFKKLSLPTKGIRTTKEGMLSTGADELHKLKNYHPIVSELLAYREAEKLYHGFLLPLERLIDKKTSRIYPTFQQTITATGRLSTTNPNLQNIPIKGEFARSLRDIFVASQKRKLLVFDYSQVELRVIASLSGDINMQEAFRRGRDIHRLTAARINGIALDKVSDQMRRKAKALNFGIIYGMSPFGLARSAGISTLEAKRFIEAYFKEFPQVKNYLDGLKKQAHKTGIVRTVLGRLRRLPDLKSPNSSLRRAAERAAINMPVQGSAADIIKLSMVNINKWLDKNRKLHIRPILQIHDELIFEVPDQYLEKAAQEISNIMEHAYRLAVPLKVDIKQGTRWGSLQDM